MAKGISESLFKKFTTESNLNYIPAIEWGIDNENTAKEQYVSKMSATHKNFVYSQAGLVINHSILILVPLLMVSFIVTVVDMGC